MVLAATTERLIPWGDRLNENRIETPSWVAPLGRISSGLYILTADTPTGGTGFLASWVQQCSFEPPMISVTIKAGRPILDHLAVGSTFGVNILPEASKRLISHFGKGFEPGENAFEGLAIRQEPGEPVILLDGLAYLQARVAARQQVGDHWLILAEVMAGEMILPDQSPAIHFRKSGLRY